MHGKSGDQNIFTSDFNLESKVMPLGVQNPIMVIESNLKSELDRRFWSDSKSNNRSEGTITIFI